jgi:putative transcriptional regulator
MEPLKAGQLLLSAPFLDDANFDRSVVLLTSYDHLGATGFILNKPSALKLFDLYPGPEHFEDFTIQYGGPVSDDNLYFLHKRPDLIPNAFSISKNLFWGGDTKALNALLDQGEVFDHEFTFFMGYSGWSPGQLENEISENSWLVVDGSGLEIFSNSGDQLWRNLLLKYGGPNKIWAHAPQNPLLN